MERTRRLQRFWAWLPAFRAVAETEHLPTASKQLHLTPPALSRTIRLLEEDLGRPLFERRGRALTLDPRGEVLLRAVRDAMRRIHEALLVVEGAELIGAVHVSVATPFAPVFVLPALEQLAAEHPQLVPAISTVRSTQVNDALLQGQLDVALLDDPTPNDALHCEELASMEHDVCVAPGHPALTNGALVESLAFVAPVALPSGHRPDAWPIGRRRNVALEVTHMQLGIDAALSGRFAIVLPEIVAKRSGLQPLGVTGMMRTTLHLVCRQPLELPGRTELVAELLRRQARAIGAGDST